MDKDIVSILALQEQLLKLRERVMKMTVEMVNLHEAKDLAYVERNRLVRFLAALFPSGIRETTIEGWDPEWNNCVYVDTPLGQMSWHYHDNQLELFADLPPYEKPWDGHTTEEKYARLQRLTHMTNTEAFNHTVDENGQPIEPVCPHCRALMCHAANRDGAYSPKRGDALMCFQCGEVSVFDPGIEGHLRLPTEQEARLISKNPDFMRARDAWNKARAETPTH